MKHKITLLSLLAAIIFISASSPPYYSWKSVEKLKIQKFKGEIVFFDYLVELSRQLKGSTISDQEMVDHLQEMHFTHPLYIARLEKKGTFMYYILRADQEKSQISLFFDMDVVQSNEEMQLYQLLDRKYYKEKMIEIIPAPACRGELIYEDMDIVQHHPDKDKLIGNGIQLIPGLFTRIIPAQETKIPFIKMIETDLAKR